MKKIFTFLILFFITVSICAQQKLNKSVSIRGGAIVNIHENVRSYFRNGVPTGIITSGFSIDGTYVFTDIFTMRISASTARNAGACNSQEVGGGFYPYFFRSVNIFSDGMIHIKTWNDTFSLNIYGGLGYAHTYGIVEEIKTGVTDWPHPWGTLDNPLPYTKEPNNIFGFRFGYLGEFYITPEVGILMDICGEFYTDMYDCLMPRMDEHNPYRGYAGFPFDMRYIISLGISYHF